MCIVSNVHDHYDPLIPSLPMNPKPYEYVPTVIQTSGVPWFPAIDTTELRRLIDEFKEAIEAAKKLDILLKQPDCVDPDKTKLQDRVALLEKAMADMKPKKRSVKRRAHR